MPVSRCRIPLVTLLLTAGLSPALPTPAEGQIMQRARQRVEQRVQEAINKVHPDAAQAAAPTAESQMKPGEGVWANYDFVPGERVLFADDFSADRVGDFPRRMELVEGSAEIVEWNKARYLSVPAFTTLSIPLPEKLPEQFTIEFEFYAGRGGSSSYSPVVLFDTSHPVSITDMSTHLNFTSSEAGLVMKRDPGGSVRQMRTKLGEIYRDKLYTVRVMADGLHVKAYINERRVSNVPNAELVRGRSLTLWIPGWQEQPSLIGNFRIASGGLELYKKIQAEGRVAMHGILFDTGSDRLRPESTPTLTEIAEVLKQNSRLSLAIEGHTDNVGNAAANQTLSEQRAAAIVRFLAETHGIAATRLEARGLGASKPAATNDTPEGRQQNRRVELVSR
jgi:OmpA-OmpF porin, OOP family